MMKLIEVIFPTNITINYDITEQDEIDRSYFSDKHYWSALKKK